MGRVPASLHYLTVLLGLLLLGAGGVAGFNAAMDPLWFFTHAHPLNRVQPGFDERAQKTNWLQARPGQFNAVMLGSSRSTYIDQNDLSPLHLFNYSVNAMWPQEYRQYLDHFAPEGSCEAVRENVVAEGGHPLGDLAIEGVRDGRLVLIP